MMAIATTFHFVGSVVVIVVVVVVDTVVFVSVNWIYCRRHAHNSFAILILLRLFVPASLPVIDTRENFKFIWHSQFTMLVRNTNTFTFISTNDNRHDYDNGPSLSVYQLYLNMRDASTQINILKWTRVHMAKNNTFSHMLLCINSILFTYIYICNSLMIYDV